MASLINFGMKAFHCLVCLLVVIILSGCVAAAVNTSTYAVKAADRDELLPLAESGDAVAQYKLGNSYCCMGAGFSTQTATAWFCKSARQGNTDAMYELGRIYDGDVARSVAPGQKLRAAISAKQSPRHALLWFTLAADRGHNDAGSQLEKLAEKTSKEDLEAVAGMVSTWTEQPCEYDQVFVPQ